jgi:peptide/nickel transport system ATP-binding protein
VRRIVGPCAGEAPRHEGPETDKRAVELAESVRFDQALMGAKPAQLSGGSSSASRSRARSRASRASSSATSRPRRSTSRCRPRSSTCSVELQTQKGVSYVFISHDLGVVRYISDRIAVMYLGRLQEVGDAETVFGGPAPPRTRRRSSRRCRHSRARSGRDPPRGRDPERGRPPLRVRLPYALPALPRRDLRAGKSRRSPRWSPGTSCAATSGDELRRLPGRGAAASAQSKTTT